MNKKDFCRAVGEEIKRLREDKGLSQEELGARVGIHRTSMSRFELGADMRLMLFIRICRALELDWHAARVRVLERILKGETE